MHFAKKIHRTLGLVMALHVTVFFASGFLLLCLEMGAEKRAFKPLTVEKLDKILASELLKEEARDPVLILRKANTLSVRLNTPGNYSLKGASRHKFKLFDDQSAEAPASDLQKFILEIHRDLGFGKKGKAYMSWVAYVYLLLILTGFLSTSFRIFRRSVLWVRSREYHNFDAYSSHATLGMLLTPFLLFMGLTGTLLYKKNDMFKDFQKVTINSLSVTENSEKKISGVEAFEKAKQIAGNKVLYFMAYPGNEYAGKNHYAVIFKESMTSDKQTLILVDAFSAKAFSPDVPWLLDLSFRSLGYHRGLINTRDFGFLWLAMALLSFLMIYSGAIIFTKKRIRGEV